MHFQKYLSICCALMLTLLSRTALAVPVYHLPSDTDAPYAASAEFVTEPPFEADAHLLQVDVLGIKLGDSIVLRLDGRSMLIDGGLKDRFSVLERYLKEQGMDGFDVLFLTHAHPDHLEAQQELIKAGYRVGKVIAPYDEDSSSELWQGYRALLNEYGIPYETLAPQDQFNFGYATLTIYQRVEKGLTVNDQSAAAMLEYGDARMFLASDITCKTQGWLLDTYGAEALKCDVYKSAHHGLSWVETSFLDAMSPAAAVVTYDQRHTAAHDRQLERRDVARYFIAMGDIHLQTDGYAWLMWQDSAK